MRLAYPRRAIAASLALVSTVALTQTAHADDPPPVGTPPPDAKPLVDAPKATDEPKIEHPNDGTNVTLSSGGQLATGNSRLLALTANGMFEKRFSANGIGFSLLGNYGQGATPGQEIHVTAENIQGRLRYDRYLAEELSLFLINTGRHDRFQGLDFRYNLDPGVKYLFIHRPATTLWVEGGYDFQYDVRRDDARPVLDAKGNPVLDSTGQPTLLDKTATDHSARLFFGFKHSFNKEVTLSTGVEYLQSLIDATRYRVNYDLVFAAKVSGGLAVGFGFGARYDHAPLPGKEQLDTSTTVSLIYAFSDAKPEPPPPPPAPVPAPPPAP
jgi:hypothetical protein